MELDNQINDEAEAVKHDKQKHRKLKKTTILYTSGLCSSCNCMGTGKKMGTTSAISTNAVCMFDTIHNIGMVFEKNIEDKMMR